MPVRHTIEKSLRKLGVVVRKKGEPDERFLDRAARACDLGEDEWNKLPSDVQSWANLALTAILAKEAPPFFDAIKTTESTKTAPTATSEEPPAVVEEPPTEVAEEPKKDPPAEVEKEEPVAAKPGKKAAKKAARKPAKKTAAKARKPANKTTKKAAKKALRKGPAYNPRKGDNAHDQFRQMVAENGTKTRKELYAMAAKAGCKMTQNSMSACIYHVDATLRVLRDRGYKVPEVSRARSQRAAAKKAAAKKTARKPRKKAAKKAAKKK